VREGGRGPLIVTFDCDKIQLKLMTWSSSAVWNITDPTTQQLEQQIFTNARKITGQ